MALCDGLNADIAVAQALVAQVGPALAAAAATTSTADAAAVAAADAQVQQLIAALQAAGISVPVPAAPTGQ